MHFETFRGGRLAEVEHRDAEDSIPVLLVMNDNKDQIPFTKTIENIVNYLYNVRKVSVRLYTYVHIKGELDENVVQHIVDKHKIAGVVVADDGLASRLALEPYSKMGMLHKNNRLSVPINVTVPSEYWLRMPKTFKKDHGLNLLGFVARAIESTAIGRVDYSIKHLNNENKYPVKPTIIKTVKQFDLFMQKLRKAPVVSVDTEGINLNKIKNRLLTIQFCIAPDSSKGQNLWLVPIAHRESPWNNKELNYIKKKLVEWFEDSNGKTEMLIYQNGKYDMIQFAEQLGVRWFARPVFDLMAALHLFDENLRDFRIINQRYYGLEAQEKRGGFKRPPDLVISKSERGQMDKFSLEDIAMYGSYDVLTPYHLAKEYIKMAKHYNVEGYVDLVLHQAGLMLKLFATMERNGVLIDKPWLQQLASPIGPLANRINEATKELYATKEVEKSNALLLKENKNVEKGEGLFKNKGPSFIFNIGKYDSQSTLFFRVLKLAPIGFRADGGGQLNKAFIEKYKDAHPIVNMFSKIGKLKKLKSAFADGVLKAMQTNEDAKGDGRLRSEFSFLTVKTGRSSSSSDGGDVEEVTQSKNGGINFQQIPSKGDDAKDIKLQLIADWFNGMIFIKSDMSAHEIRTSGILGKDKVVKKTFLIANEAIRVLRLAKVGKALEKALENFKKNGDVHVLNIRFFYGREVDLENPEDAALRQEVKITVFRTLYGTGLAALAEAIKQPLEKAKELVDALFGAWGGVKKFMDKCRSDGFKYLRVRSPIGRYRNLPAYLFGGNNYDAERQANKAVAAMDRQGPNAVNQGYAADIVHIAAYCFEEEVWYTLTSKGLLAQHKLVLMVHDSLTVECPFHMLPVMSYFLEHAQTTLAMLYLEEVFDVNTTIPFAFDMGFGHSEGAIDKWKDLRFDEMESSLRKFAKDKPQYKKLLNMALHNYAAIRKVRERELVNDPYEMTLRDNTEWFKKNIKGWNYERQ